MDLYFGLVRVNPYRISYTQKMAISLATIRQEIKELMHKREELDKKIEALKELQKAYHLNQEKPTSGVRNIDIRPYITKIFEGNDNQPLRKKEIVSQVAKASDLPKDTVDGKMIPIMRKGFIESSGEYGKYRLKNKNT